MSDQVLCVTAILFNAQGQVLLYQRDNNPQIPFPGHWSTLGGVVEPGESPTNAIHRELLEEIELDIPTDFWKVYERTHLSGVKIQQHVFVGCLNQPVSEIVLNEGQSLAYFEQSDLVSLPIGFGFETLLKEFFETDLHNGKTKNHEVSQYVAFLRAINVGKRRVKMDVLRDLFVQLGFANVETLIASGNVIFEADAPDEAAIATHLENALGYEVTTWVRTMDELQAINQYVPFPKRTDDSETVRVGFLHSAPAQAAIDKLENTSEVLETSEVFSIDQFHVNGREAYWWRKQKSSEFTANKMEKLLGMRTTLRNMNTVGRIIKKYG